MNRPLPRATRNMILNSSHLASLHTFESAARLLSFKKAAEELCVTPSAVSHRIINLERQLGIQLFHRHPRRLLLSDEGQRIFALVGQTIERLHNEIQDIRNNEMSGSLTIFARPSVTQCWLVPRIADFNRKYPAITLNIRTGNENVDFRTQSVDVALYYTCGTFHGLTSIKLMNEEITPVCSPKYAQAHDLQGHPEHLRNCTLLHDSYAWPDASYDTEWRFWSQTYGIEGLPFETGITFDRSDLTVIAAINHAGVAIGRKRLVEKRLQSGELVAPFREFSSHSSYNYYLVFPKGPPHPRLSVLIDWLQQQAEGEKKLEDPATSGGGFDRAVAKTQGGQIK